jgi:hypothetical protein
MRQKLGWWLMGIPWISTDSFKRGFARKNWHARLYLLGGRLASKEKN